MSDDSPPTPGVEKITPHATNRYIQRFEHIDGLKKELESIFVDSLPIGLPEGTLPGSHARFHGPEDVIFIHIGSADEAELQTVWRLSDRFTNDGRANLNIDHLKMCADCDNITQGERCHWCDSEETMKPNEYFKSDSEDSEGVE